MLDAIDPHRKRFGLKTFAELRALREDDELPPSNETILSLQKTETVEALSKIAQPCPGIKEVRNNRLADILYT